jgi:hypothetical protein
MRQLFEVHSRAPDSQSAFKMQPDCCFCLSLRNPQYRPQIVSAEAILHAAAPKKHAALRELRILNRFMRQTS